MPIVTAAIEKNAKPITLCSRNGTDAFSNHSECLSSLVGRVRRISKDERILALEAQFQSGAAVAPDATA